ncbi:hypothetical protein [Sinomonas sp. P47F7]|uniref:hypothetical protein n=1 Tax=Sinomonas sp. P47F7 TaxID=3410987 RepID=UPI003BF56C70
MIHHDLGLAASQIAGAVNDRAFKARHGQPTNLAQIRGLKPIGMNQNFFAMSRQPKRAGPDKVYEAVGLPEVESEQPRRAEVAVGEHYLAEPRVELVMRYEESQMPFVGRQPRPRVRTVVHPPGNSNEDSRRHKPLRRPVRAEPLDELG